jgi:hypothetical protein
MQEPEDTLTPVFKMLNIIYIALGVGMLLSIAVFIFLIRTSVARADSGLAGILTIVVPVVGISSFGAGRFLYKMNAKKSKEETDVAVKLNNYRAASIIVWATMEGPALFSAVGYYLTGDQIFLLFFSVIFLGFIFSKPSIEKFQQDF